MTFVLIVFFKAVFTWLKAKFSFLKAKRIKKSVNNLITGLHILQYQQLNYVHFFEAL